MSCLYRQLELALVVGFAATLVGFSLAIAQVPSAPINANQTITGTAVIAADRFTLGDGSVRLPFGAQAGEATFILSADQISKDAMGASSLKVTDVRATVPGRPTKVDFRIEGELPASTSARRWVVTAVASELLINEEQTRFAQVDIGELRRIVPYTLTNRLRAPPSFTATLSTPWVMNGGKKDANALLIVTGDQAITGLRLANSTLAEKATGIPLRVQSLELCQSADAVCETPARIPALASSTLYLRSKAGDHPHGRFVGTLALAVDARPDPIIVLADVSSSTLCAKVGGGVVILLGVGFAWLLTVWSRARLDRLAALRPALQARLRILELLGRLNAAAKVVGFGYPALATHYAVMAETLTEEGLDLVNRLPPRMPSVTSNAVSDLKTYLEQLQQPIIRLTVLVNDGIEPLTVNWRNAANATDQTLILDALKTLDAPLDTAVETDAHANVAAAKAAAAPPPPVGIGMAIQGPAAAPVALQLRHVSAQIDTLNVGIWVIYLLLTSVIGCVLLVVNNSGFGTAMDYIYCLLWGFGLPTTFDKLAQVAPSTISTSVGIALPK